MTCSLESHRKLEAHRNENGKALFQLKTRLGQSYRRSNTGTDDPVDENACDEEGDSEDDASEVCQERKPKKLQHSLDVEGPTMSSLLWLAVVLLLPGRQCMAQRVSRQLR